MAGYWARIGVGIGLIAAPAGAQESAALAPGALIRTDSLSVLMAEAVVVGGSDPDAPTLSPLLALKVEQWQLLGRAATDAATDFDRSALALTINAYHPGSTGGEGFVAPRLDLLTLDRMSLQGSADYARRRSQGINARLQLRLDGRDDSEPVQLGGHLARAVKLLER